jgi:uncharacterized protein YnzC (UPF0291/DUF896 family)
MEMLEKLGYTYAASISGVQTEVGISESLIENITIFDPRGNDVTDTFQIATNPGKLQVFLYEITLQTKNLTKVYDGQPIQDAIHYSSKQLQKGHRLAEITFLATPNVGQKSHSFDVKIVDARGNDVTMQYLIHKEYGTLTITPAPLTLRADSQHKKYDGRPMTCHSYVISNGQLCQGHSIADISFSGQQTNIGRCDNMITDVTIVDAEGKDVSSNYSIVLLPGLLQVTYS